MASDPQDSSIPGPAPIDARLPVLDAGLVRRLIAGQFPDWAGLPVQAMHPQGHDNRSFRLGEALLVRLPSAQRYAGQVAKEQHWLPILAAGLPVEIPQPVALGRAAEGYPIDWSIYRWLPGRVLAPGDDLSRLAGDLARVLRALQGQPVAGAPAAGPQNFHRGGDLRVYDAETRRFAGTLPRGHDRDAVLAIWNRALTTSWQHAPVWLHGDLAPGNLLMRDGRLAALIDFGNCAIGDPAADLALAWSLLDAPARAAFRLALRFDPATWERARGWALWKALSMLHEGPCPAAETCLAQLLAEADPDAGG
ncbi:aminoglycoside phosphotransferase family protein [Frigidibacter sp. ROC022]|uniref:aminoglycoside phosphotransferase family protein n=1 Tax=Frigidibacter sp. ROC022 TaxID=2971796 RepID=UPI00215A83D7|nr:aminoglycoside phosphotransferase family protein [Frigidibacter sp. ROC022]MCR8726370.1 aminoglycoside phosphotransferase family protein [Frigidibacter sp. ROC022]